MAKLASARYLDALPRAGNEFGQAFRDVEMEAEILALSRELGIGAQFGGKYFCHDVRVVRMPRHGASCPVGMAVSCSAHRNVKAKINKDGIWIEKLDKDPARWLAEAGEAAGGDVVQRRVSDDGGHRVCGQRPVARCFEVVVAAVVDEHGPVVDVGEAEAHG